MGYVVRVRFQQCRWITPHPVQNASILQVKCVCMRLKQALRHALTPLQRNSLFQSCQIGKNPHFSNFLLEKGIGWIVGRSCVWSHFFHEKGKLILILLFESFLETVCTRNRESSVHITNNDLYLLVLLLLLLLLLLLSLLYYFTTLKEDISNSIRHVTSFYLFIYVLFVY